MTEQYLIDDYDLIEDPQYLSCEDDIESYCKDLVHTFDCGQGYYQDNDTFLFKIKDKFYDVYVTADIGSAKQDRGERLYWVEGIKDVTWDEAEKPLPVDKIVKEYILILSKEQEESLDTFLLEKGITVR